VTAERRGEPVSRAVDIEGGRLPVIEEKTRNGILSTLRINACRKGRKAPVSARLFCR